MAPLNDNRPKLRHKLRMLFAVASIFLVLFGSAPVWAAPSHCVGAISTSSMPLAMQVYTVTSAQFFHTPQMPESDPCCYGGLVCSTCAGAPLGGVPIALRDEPPAAKVSIAYLPRSSMVPRGFSVRPNLPPPRAWA